MATQQAHEVRIPALTAAGSTLQQMETTMNETTLSGFGRAFWTRRASAGLIALALVGAAGIGMVRSLVVEQPALLPTSSTLVAPAASDVSERFRALKIEQAEQRANLGMTPVQAISEHYRELKMRQVDEQLEAAPVVNSPAAPSARQRFAAMKDRQAMEREQDSFTATSVAAPISDVYRALKTRQIDAMLAGEASAAHWSDISDEYRALKQRQVMAALDQETFSAQPAIPEEYRALKQRQLEQVLSTIE